MDNQICRTTNLPHGRNESVGHVIGHNSVNHHFSRQLIRVRPCFELDRTYFELRQSIRTREFDSTRNQFEAGFQHQWWRKLRKKVIGANPIKILLALNYSMLKFGHFYWLKLVTRVDIASYNA